MSSTCHVYLHIQRIGPCFYGSYGLSAVEKFTFDDRCIVCKNNPRCDTYVRVRPGTMEPIGTLANGRLRALRTEAHRYFNQLYERGIMSKREAYEWLSQMIGLPMSKTHIGMMGEYYCELVIEESKKLLGGTRRQRKGYYLMNHVGGYRNEINSGAAACG